MFSFPSLPGAASGAPLQFVITSDQDFTQLNDVAGDLIGKAMQSGKFMFLDKSMDMTLPQTKITIDRNSAGDLGVDMDDIGITLATFLGGNYINRFSLQGRSYEVIPQVARQFRSDHRQLDQYYVRNSHFYGNLYRLLIHQFLFQD